MTQREITGNASGSNIISNETVSAHASDTNNVAGNESMNTPSSNSNNVAGNESVNTLASVSYVTGNETVYVHDAAASSDNVTGNAIPPSANVVFQTSDGLRNPNTIDVIIPDAESEGS